MKENNHKKILISLIHNNNQDRLSYIKPKIEKLIDLIGYNHKVDLIESSYQPSIKGISFATFFIKEIIFFILDRKWTKYRGYKEKPFIIKFPFFMLILLKKIFNKKEYNNLKRVYEIEIYLNNKHTKSYLYAIENKYDYLFVFEDDVIFKDDSLEKFSSFIDSLPIPRNDFLYVDMAGGLNLEDLRIDKLNYKNDNLFKYFSKSVTNTSACYLMNMRQFEYSYFVILQNPLFRYLPSDWLLNAIFIKQEKDQIKTDCFHFYPSIFSHGSIDGYYKSLIR